ncbi:MAG: D-glycero-beta-D-manno-heptose-7-phosphate kinase [Candidatus Omnitrophica bacterium]|nr:D-glycero-beta-D-manno-heptose-7-phosphate kinase [Candidatus Omnitrophota bacterium]
MSIEVSRVSALMKKFHKSNILVIGDLILDKFIWGDVSRISPEAPVPVVLVNKESSMPGGAANVACSINALNGKTSILGVIGNDSDGKMLKKQLNNLADTSGLIIDETRHTILKTRIVARHQQLVRVDREQLGELSKKVLFEIIKYVRKHASLFDAIIIEDYGKGVISPDLIREVVSIAKKKNIIVTVDPKEDHFTYYKGVTCLTPNQSEAEKAIGIKITDEKSLFAAGKKFLHKLDCSSVLITRGEHGMCLFEKGKKPFQIPTRAQEVFDVSGAGDTVIAAFTLALASGAEMQEAAHISNYAAGVVVGKVGVGTCTQEELMGKILMQEK